MKFTETVYHVVSLSDFLDHLVAKVPGFENVDPSDLLDTISDSGEVSFGDAVDTLVSAKTVCEILECDVPSDLDPNMLVGLGS